MCLMLVTTEYDLEQKTELKLAKDPIILWCYLNQTWLIPMNHSGDMIRLLPWECLQVYTFQGLGNGQSEKCRRGTTSGHNVLIQISLWN